MEHFVLKSPFQPAGSQPQAIASLVNGLKKKLPCQTLLGVTGSGKTFTLANVIAHHNKPTLVIAHNKTLAAQLWAEFKEFFPDNRVEYFISYYDYYQPESYIPQKDMYIEKDSAINPKIEQLRLAATASLLSRNDVIIVASVSCIYGLGSPENFKNLGFEVAKGMSLPRQELLQKLVTIQFERNDTELLAGRFRVKGDVIDLIPGYGTDIIRIELSGNTIESIKELDKNTSAIQEKLDYFDVFPARHFVMRKEEVENALGAINEELEERLPELGMLEAHRLKQRTLYDLEMMQETGYCKGIENYSRHFEKRAKGTPPFVLLDYFPQDFLLVIDESHQTIPQLHGMQHGDYTRKKNLVDYGFRLPSAFDNRPLKFHEFETHMHSVIFVSATPGAYELEKSKNLVEQIIRPTGLVDPLVEVRKIDGQIPDLLGEIKKTISSGNRVLVTTLTKKLAEELAEYFAGQGVKTRYLHSDIDALERTEVIRQLRLGKFDVLVGINLLREGIDIPEVALVGILDADKEGFLRDEKSLIQTIGRAARNVDSKVILYADRETDSIKRALAETNRRREIQIAYNKEHHITPTTIVKAVKEKEIDITDTKHVPKSDIPGVITELEEEMALAAETLHFERAIALRDQIKKLRERMK
jgi:excinuclease ABC subunit B